MSMKMGFALAVAGWCVLGGPAGATRPIRGELDVAALARIEFLPTGRGQIATALSNDRWLDAPEDLLAQVRITAMTERGDSATANALSVALWNGPDSGEVRLGHGRRAEIIDNNTNWAATSGLGQWDFFYAFQAERDGFFEIDWTLGGSTNIFPADGWGVFWSEDPSGSFVPAYASPFGRVEGGFTRPLIDGGIYSVWIRQAASVLQANASNDSAVGGTFNWRIGPVPEPVPEAACLPLLIAGLGGLLAARHRRAT